MGRISLRCAEVSRKDVNQKIQKARRSSSRGTSNFLRTPARSVIIKSVSMVKPITNVLLNSISGLPATNFNRVITSSVCHNGLKYSTSAPDGPESHEDFKTSNNLEDYRLSLKDAVEKDIKDNSVIIYMKGVPDMPRCGFSSLAVRVLKVYDFPFSARNILENPELKNAVKSVSNWPTFPQIFIKGEFIGGSDIILNMHQTGELKEKLKDVAAKQDESH